MSRYIRRRLVRIIGITKKIVITGQQEKKNRFHRGVLRMTGFQTVDLTDH